MHETGNLRFLKHASIVEVKPLTALGVLLLILLGDLIRSLLYFHCGNRQLRKVIDLTTIDAQH